MIRTKADYDAYVSNVEHFLRINHVKPGCHSALCKECGDGEAAEPFFSWSPCECCGSTLGGNRETYNFAVEPSPLAMVHFGSPARQNFQADICVDCVYFLAYGTLDDEIIAAIAITNL